MQISFFWFFYFFILWIGRLFLLSALYFMDTPSGGLIVGNVSHFFPQAMVIEAGIIATFTLCFVLIHFFIKSRSFTTTAIIFGFLYLFLSACDDELIRWMGQHLSFSFLSTYVGSGSGKTDFTLVSKIFVGGLFHFLVSISIVLLSTFFVFLFRRRFYDHKKSTLFSGIFIFILLLISIAGLSSRYWFSPNVMRWKRIQPVFFGFYNEWRSSFRQDRDIDYEEGILFLGGNPENEYPFWVHEPKEDSILQAFREKPFEEKPDIILLMIESFRGWTGDFRVEKNCKRMPHLCSLTQSGTFFPNTHSVGFPSIEGMLGVQVGVWSHLEKTFLSDRASVSMRALPEILGDLGYYRMVLTASEPSFDNLTPWFAKWFDFSEYRPENNHDIPIANRFSKLYGSRPENTPLFFTWISATMHAPFTLPHDSGEGEDPKNPAVRYERALSYTDKALGIVLEEIKKSPRAKNTIIILTGDHAFTTQSQNGISDTLGSIHAGYTWVPLIWSGPLVEAGKVDSRIVSHVDIAPSLLSLLDVSVSHHFVGRNLWKDSLSFPIFSFRHNYMVLQKDSSAYHALIEDPSFVFRTKILLDPLWDTTQSVEGFVRYPSEVLNDSSIILKNKMLAAAKAWRFVVDQNKLRPSAN